MAIGRPWKDASPKIKLVNLFNKLLINSYAAAFTNYFGIVIEVEQKIDANRGTVPQKLNCQWSSLTLEYEFLLKIHGNFDVKIDGIVLLSIIEACFHKQSQQAELMDYWRN